MRAKSFAYVCAGVLMLATVATFEPLSVSADIAASESHVIDFSGGTIHIRALRSDGTLWYNNPSWPGWRRATAQDGGSTVEIPPVPIAEGQLAHFHYPFVMSISGETWYYDDKDASIGWVSLGILPHPGTVSVEQSDIGQVKAKYRE